MPRKLETDAMFRLGRDREDLAGRGDGVPPPKFHSLFTSPGEEKSPNFFWWRMAIIADLPTKTLKSRSKKNIVFMDNLSQRKTVD